MFAKTLISMKQDLTRDKTLKRTLLQKLVFKVIEKEKPSWMFSLNLQLTENGRPL